MRERFLSPGVCCGAALALLVALPAALPAASQERMVYGETGRLAAFDPYTIHETSGHRLADLLFDSLITLGPGGAYQAALARSWEIAADGLSITLSLRSDVRWHQTRTQPGLQPLTAADVVKTVA